MVSYRIVAVDDEPSALRLMQRVLAQDEDVDLHTARSPRQALELVAASEEVDLVISDRRMPEMDGLAFLARIRELRPGARRILFTAYPDMALAIEGFNDGALHRLMLNLPPGRLDAGPPEAVRVRPPSGPR